MLAAAIHLQEPSVFVKLISNHYKPVSGSNVAVERRTVRLLHQLLVWESVEESSRVGGGGDMSTVWAQAGGLWAAPPRTAPQLKSNDWMPDIPGQSVQ